MPSEGSDLYWFRCDTYAGDDAVLWVSGRDGIVEGVRRAGGVSVVVGVGRLYVV